ncbi:MAG: hypothetical protein D6734_04500 [Candidatus Schekmanbacteria bacterium]|nr:MAG: hypothetical protein D6734_04500 [Candidatus Schekmanbacteria bacterium]
MKIYRYIAILLVFSLPLVVSCKKEEKPDVTEQIENLKNRINNLSRRIAAIEERLYKASKRSPTVVKKAAPTEKKPFTRKPFEKVNREKFPKEFNYPEFGIKIIDFKCYRGTGNIAAYYGKVVAEKDVQMLNLSIYFYDRSGRKIGGHAFPVKVITANSPREFQNGDIIEGGFDKIESMDLQVDFVSYSDFTVKGRAVEEPMF